MLGWVNHLPTIHFGAEQIELLRPWRRGRQLPGELSSQRTPAVGYGRVVPQIRSRRSHGLWRDTPRQPIDLGGRRQGRSALRGRSCAHSRGVADAPLADSTGDGRWLPCSLLDCEQQHGPGSGSAACQVKPSVTSAVCLCRKRDHHYQAWSRSDTVPIWLARPCFPVEHRGR
jgi:hypothetical protein